MRPVQAGLLDRSLMLRSTPCRCARTDTSRRAPARSLPRMSTCTCSPVAAGTRAKPIERSSVGENVPLVISPSPTPGDDDFLVAAQHAAILEHEADELAGHAGAALRFERGAADEVALWRDRTRRSTQGPIRAASGSRPCRCRTGSSPLRGAACRARRVRTARRPRRAAPPRMPPHRCAGSDDFPAVLAGVTGRRDEMTIELARRRKPSCPARPRRACR